MSEERTLLLSNAPLAFDAPECGQPRKARCVRRRHEDNAGAAALELIVPFLLSFVRKGELAGRIGQRAKALIAQANRGPLLPLSLRAAMAARRADLLGHFGMAVQSVGSDPAALQIQAFQRFATSRRPRCCPELARGDRYAGLLQCPDAHHQWRHARTPALIAAPQAFAVESDQAPTGPAGRGLRARLHKQKFRRLFLQFRRIERGETKQSRENCRGSARRAANRPPGQFPDVSGGKISIAHATISSAKRSDQRNEKHRRAIMPRVEVSGIANLAQNSNQDFHQSPSESGSRPKNPFLRSTQYPYIHMRFPWPKGGGGNRRPHQIQRLRPLENALAVSPSTSQRATDHTRRERASERPLTGRRSGPNLPCSCRGKRGRLPAFTGIYRA